MRNLTRLTYYLFVSAVLSTAVTLEIIFSLDGLYWLVLHGIIFVVFIVGFVLFKLGVNLFGG